MNALINITLLRLTVTCLTVLSLAVLINITAHAQTNTGTPRVWEAPIVIPTYELGPPNPYPALLDWQRRKWRPVYPYPFLDSLTNKRTDKSWKAVYLENEYLKVIVLPELGGHVYQIFDKTLNRDVIYSNPVIKYAMVALRGAWVSGGIEWNFPDGHTLTTVSPIDYVMRTEADGSAAVAVGDTERVQGMQWQVIIRLRPGQRAVETEVTLNNRREIPGRYWFWSTAGAPATDDMRFIYPMREAYPHAFWPVFSFPKEKGVDISKFSEVPNFLSLFARNSYRDYFGVYYEKSDWGIIHVADHREMPGKKTWTWGTDDNGDIWIDKLTDGGHQYVEFQGGRFETQMEHQFIVPHRVEHFVERWFPVNNLGGAWDEATADMALRLSYKDNSAIVTATSNARFKEAQFCSSGEAGCAQSVDLEPGKIFTFTIPLPIQNMFPPPVAVSFRTKEGRELIRYSNFTPVDGNPDFQPARRPTPDPIVSTSAEQSFVEGFAFDKKSKDRDARASYNETLNRDPGFAPAHVALGLSFYRNGNYVQAINHLKAALLRNKDSGDAHYYLGLVYRDLERMTEAEDHLLWAVRSGYRESVACYVLGQIELVRGRPRDAVEWLNQAVMLDPRDLKARTVLALAERLEGRLDAAQGHIDAVVQELPIDYFALHEQYEIRKAQGQEAKATAAANEFWRLMSREPDSVLEVSLDYSAVGRRADAESILEEAIRRGQDGKRVYPMFYYMLAYLYERDHNIDRARALRALGAREDPGFVFPHRVEEIRALSFAIDSNNSDGRAAYYLGNALAANNRDEEALRAWNYSLVDPSNIVARRNLARARWLVEGNKDEAARQYEYAIAKAPDDYRLYIEFDRLLTELGPVQRRLALLEGAPATVKSQSAFVQSLAGAYIDAGRFADAAALLEKTAFTSGEGEDAALALYRKAHLGLARKYQESGDHLKAATEFAAVTEYPRNLGVGRPAMQSQAREYIAAAREYALAGNRDESERWWNRAATEELNPPTQPEEPWSEHYFYKAVALDHVGRKAEARVLYERLARLNDEQRMLKAEPWPPSGAIRFVLAGAALKALGRKDEARTALERALKMDPQNELALSQLAELKADRTNIGQ